MYSLSFSVRESIGMVFPSFIIDSFSGKSNIYTLNEFKQAESKDSACFFYAEVS